MAPVVVLSALVLASCAVAQPRDEETTIVATTSLLADLVAGVAGDQAKVESVIPRGADAHDYSPTPSQVAAIAGADLVVAVGGGLEESLEAVLDSARAEGVVVLELLPAVDPLPAEGSAGGEALDPHFWMDPIRVAMAADHIADELERIVPGGGWAQRAEAYESRLLSAHDAITAVLGAIPPERRKLVTNHDAFRYLADRYGFEVIGTIIPGGSTLGSPGSARLAELVDLIRTEGVPALFAETSQPTTLAETIAAEIGDDFIVVQLHTESLGEPGSAADTLIGMLTENARLIAEALGG